MAVALAQRGSFGFALQSAKSIFAAPDTWLPVTDGNESIELRKNYVTLDMADAHAHETQYLSTGQWAEGKISVPLVPGVIVNLLSWIQNRDTDGQGKWASILIDCVNEIKKLRDAKIRTATFDFVKGKPVTCTLDVAALHIESGTPANPVMPSAAPYIYQEAHVSISTEGGAITADANCEAIRIVIDNMVEDCADGMRLAPSDEPLQLYNVAGCRVRGAITRDFVDNAVYADFATGQEAALTIGLSRGVSTATLTLPRILYTADRVSLPGSHEKRIRENVQFIALGSIDGTTTPITLT